MNKKILVIIGILIVVLLVAFGTHILRKSEGTHVKINQGTSPKDATYSVDGKSITLLNGVSTTTASDSVSKTITQYFGNEAMGDLNGDGIPDVGFILTQNSGGSGTFYYAVAAIKSGQNYLGTNAILLGDRISPQTTEIKDGVLIVNYTDRNPGESMTTAPSKGTSKYLLIENGSLVEAPSFATDLYPLYSGASWGALEAKISSDFGVVAQMQSEPFSNITDIASKSTPFLQYYQQKLTKAGWTQDTSHQADGPGSAASVYRKSNQFVVISFQSLFHLQQPNTPSQCPCDVQFSLMSGFEQ